MLYYMNLFFNSLNSLFCLLWQDVYDIKCEAPSVLSEEIRRDVLVMELFEFCFVFEHAVL